MNVLSKVGKRWDMIIAAVLLTAAVLVLLPPLLYDNVPLPPGTNMALPPVTVAAGDIRLLIDETAWDAEAGRRVIRQEIFDEILSMVDRADQFVYIDLFLWNPWQGDIPENHRRMSTELAEALIRKKRADRKTDIIVLTDPINRIYAGHEPEFFKDMAKAGIPVVFTDLARLPDSNSLYSPYWSVAEKILNSRLLERWSSRPGFSNPFDRDGEDISALQWGRMLLFKANHRKVVVTGSSRHGLEMLVGSLNPADGSSAHSNLALKIRGPAALYPLTAELTALRWSLERKRNVIVGATSMAGYKADSIRQKALGLASASEAGDSGMSIQWLSEGAIADALIELLGSAGKGDDIRIAVFYLSDRGVVEAIRKAAERGARVRIVLDANRDAFGMKKIGVPNRPVAAELLKLSPDQSMEIRWADTHGEQFHTKAMSITYGGTGERVLMAGSANWTRRNIRNLNLEVNLLVRDAGDLAVQFEVYFDRIWDNSDGLSHTLPYSAWEERGLKRFFKTRIYRFQERFGMGTF